MLLPGAREGLLSLKAAGHTLILWSARASPAILFGESVYAAVFDPHFRPQRYKSKQEIQLGRFTQMLQFVKDELPGIFSAASSDKAGLDLFIDDKALRVGHGPTAANWDLIRHWYGEESPKGEDHGDVH